MKHQRPAQPGARDAPPTRAGDRDRPASTQDFDDAFKTNVYAMFWITKAALPHLAPGAAIINTASVNAYDPGENIIDYAATKARS
jgi:NAD(P)-dependent dehydrogenase (short-subunit alcohol dehydrogenase family)